MDVSFSRAKDTTNKAKHGISLARTVDFDFDAALYDVDNSQDYGELRLRAISFLDGMLHVLVFSPRDHDAVRAISLRRATRQEHRIYAED